MKTLHKTRTPLLALLAMSACAPALAVDRCNTKFTFHNTYSFPVTVSGSIEIRGNQGDYKEALDKAQFTLAAGARATTRQNRLQKVDDGTRAEFKITVGSQYGSISYQQRWKVESINRTRNVQHGTLLLDQQCADGKFIEFKIKPLPDTPANRQAIFQELGSSATAQDRTRALAREFNVLP